jgi:cell division transport system permease protein
MNRSFGIVKRNLRRAPYQALTASMVMFMTFLCLSIFILLALGSQAILRYYESKPQAIAFFKDQTSDSDITSIQDALNKTGKVTSLHYVSKQEALQIYRDQNKDQPALLELVTANILPSSLEISTESPEDLGPIADVLKNEPVIDQVIYPADVVQNLSKATNIVRWVGGSATVFLIVFSSLIILIVIGFKIRLRRTEIETMKLLGASTWFIRWPFLLEGMTYGVLGAISGWLVSFGVLWYFTPMLKSSLGEINLLPVSPITMLSLLLVELVVALLIGGLGSYGAVRRYLRL